MGSRKHEGRSKKKVYAKDIEDYAITELGLMPDDFHRLTWADYMRLCIRKAKQDIQRMREIRLISAFITGKHPRELFTLPGDWDHVKLRTHEERLELAKKFGVYEKWGLGKLKEN